MKTMTKFTAVAAVLFAIGCGSDDTSTTGGETEVRERCTSKCDDIVSSQRALNSLVLDQVEGGYVMGGDMVEGFEDDEVWIDIEMENGEFVYEELYPNAETFTYESPEPFDIPEFEQITVYAFGQINGVRYEQKFTFTGVGRGSEEGGEQTENNTTGEDPFASAYDVEAAMIIIPEDAEVPEYDYPEDFDNFDLGGTEFWQKWTGGHNPTYDYEDGTDAGRKCMYASARRFEAIMADPPANLVELVENSNWYGSFFNWNDDFSAENARGSAGSAALWAWRTSLVKWISQTGQNGECYLVTKSMAERFGTVGLARAEREDGEIQGAQSR